MKRRLALALATACLSASESGAAGWEIEAGAGMMGSADFSVPGPFTYRGVSFEREYTNCQLEFRDHPRGALFGCFAVLGFLGSFNPVYSREHDYGPTFVADLALRRRVSGPFSVAAGILGGLVPGKQRVHYEAIPLSLDAPPIPDQVRDARMDPDFTQFRHTDTGALAYLHADLRYEWRLGRVGGALQHPVGHAIFLAAGGGILPAVPGGEESQVGTPFAWHVAAGFRLSRALGPDYTLSLVHLHAVSDPPEGIAARYSWTGLRLGVVFER